LVLVIPVLTPTVNQSKGYHVGEGFGLAQRDDNGLMVFCEGDSPLGWYILRRLIWFVFLVYLVFIFGLYFWFFIVMSFVIVIVMLCFGFV